MTFVFGSSLNFVECLVLLLRKHSGTACLLSVVVFGLPAMHQAL